MCAVLALVGAGPAGADQAATADGFEYFITRRGDRLYEGDKEFRFAGANMPGLSLPYDYTLRLPERLKLPTVWEQTNAFETLVAMNARVVRLWNLPMRGPADDWMDWAYVQGPGRFNEESFKTLDSLLALANRHRIRVIFSLSAEWGDYLGGIGEYAAWRGKDRGAFYTDEQLKADFKQTLQYVVNRRNTVTGRRYRDDKAILAWQLGNELRNAPLAWEGEMADYLKSLDPNHLVMAGNDARVPLDPPENLDILVRHYYRTDWSERCREDRALAAGVRPFIVGEYGLEKDVGLMRRFHEETWRNGTAGSLIWSLYSHHRDGGFYWHQIFTDPSIGSFHWPGFSSGAAHNEREMLAILREYAFRMAGAEMPPVAVPKSPELLHPGGRLPLISWRGSAGAEGYDIQRAESAAGPWTVVARNVSDADVAYRPLFNDTTIRAGRSYFYRVAARNTSGLSEPSNVIGPVRFESRVLVDEFHDLRKARAASAGLVINNDYNGLYAEYLYRAKGTAGDHLVYELPGDATLIQLWAFHGEGSCDPVVAVSANGRDYVPVPWEARQATPLRSFAKVKQLEGMSRTLVEQQAVPGPGARFVRIEWQGPLELDRLQIEHRDED